MTEANKKLPAFLRRRAGKSREFSVEMSKGDSASCPACGNVIFSNGAFAGCICYGDSRQRKVFVRPTDSGVQVRFGRGWDAEDMEMLVETLRRRNSQ